MGNLNIHPSRYALPTVKVARLQGILAKVARFQGISTKGSSWPEEASKVSDKVEEEENIPVTSRDILLILLPTPPHFRSNPGNVLRSSLKET